MAWKQRNPGLPDYGYNPSTFEGNREIDDRSSLMGRALSDTTVWNNFGGTGVGTFGPSDQGSAFATPVREAVVTNANLLLFGTTENMTRWNPWVPGANGYSQGGDINAGSAQAVEPLPVSSHNFVGTGNFFGSDPSLWGASLSMQTSWEHMALGGSVMLGHQTFTRAPVQSQFSPEFYPSTVYEPAPSFGSVVPKVV